MHTPEVLDHFQHPRNAGELPSPPAVVLAVENPACGDVLRLSARIESGVVAEAAYRVRGCTASIAAGSVLTELMLRRTRAELEILRAEDLDASLGGLPPESRHAAVLAADALRALLRSWPPD